MTGLRKGTTSTIRAVTKLRDALVTGFRSNSQAVEISSIILQRLFFFKLLSTLGLVPTEMLSNEFSRVSQSSIVSLIVHGSGVRSPSDRNQLEIVRVVSRLGLFKPTNSQRAFSEEIDHSFLSDCVHALDALGVDGPNTTAPVDDRILLLGLLYESIKSRGGRKSGGIFYTPFELAERICSHSLDAFLEDWMSTSVLKFIHRILSLRVLDNSCGGGVFLLAMLQRLVEILRSKSGDLDSPARLMKSHGFDCRSTASVAAHILEHCLFGVDLDQGAVNVTEAQLWMVMAALTGSLKCGNSTTNLKTGDSLLPLWPEGIVFDIIVGNPPYLRLSSLDASYRADLKTRYRTAREYNIHALFVEASMKQLAPEGVLGYLVHKNLLTLSSFTQLRKRLLTHHRLKHISDCGSGVFKGVAAETSFIILKKGPQRGTSSVSLSRYDTRVADCFVNTTIPQKEYENLIAPWSHRFLAGIDTKDAELLDSLSHLPRLTDFVSIRRGIETGQNNRFVSVDQRARGNWQPIVRGRDIAAYMAVSRVFL
ncbi:MAG: HsdM family class I SAM-dependent methyltransferase, partial [Candidatus Thorarchaeota archaeon]